ncbi:MAG: sigma-70 family RNA polymerase sigma factor [Eubacteriales bacterium]|nr:sigma-70 family RNA polymerase sigma factor [Eubacteriales bacterium]
MNKKEAFTEAYRSYSGLVMKSVMTQTSDVELAQEICQNTFIKYYQNMDKVNKDFIKAWLLHVAKNMLIDYWRKASTRKELCVNSDSEEVLECSSGQDVETEFVNKMFATSILQELWDVNRDWYNVIDCIYLRELTIAEAAEYLEIDSKVLSARLYRAKQYLRKKYMND